MRFLMTHVVLHQTSFIAIWIVFSFSIIGCRFAIADGPSLKPWTTNAWYWSIDDQPVLLLGGSDDDNLFQWPADRLVDQLNRIADAGGNVIRNTMSDRQDGGFEEYAFLQLESGKYDLDRWNPIYWQRFETMLSETAKRNIVVQIEIWDRFDFTDVRKSDPHRWEKKHPFNPRNNVNYTFGESGFEPRYPDHPGANKQPFFFTTPDQRNNQVVLKYQDRFVSELLSHSLKYDHVLYCIYNETKAEPAWAKYWTDFIRAKAEIIGKQVMITEMWDDWDLKAERHRQTFDHPERYDFVDVSQNNQNAGQEHWDNFLFVRNYLKKQPRPMNTTKTYGADGNKFGHSDQDAIERFWRHLLAGAASIRFHRPDSGLGISDKAVACIRAARIVEKAIPLWDVAPSNQLLLDRSKNEAYLSASADRTMVVVYFPATKEKKNLAEARLAASELAEKYQIQWVDIDLGKRLGKPKEFLTSETLVAPSQSNLVAVLLGR
ncbi:MAG: hypothetical protein AAF664_12165 [Planctomycetota bacterium]